MQSAPTIHITETVEKGIQDVQGQREGTCVGKYWHPRVFTAGGGGCARRAALYFTFFKQVLDKVQK